MQSLENYAHPYIVDEDGKLVWLKDPACVRLEPHYIGDQLYSWTEVHVGTTDGFTEPGFTVEGRYVLYEALVETPAMTDEELLLFVVKGDHGIDHPWYTVLGRSVADMTAAERSEPFLANWFMCVQLERQEALARLRASSIVDEPLERFVPDVAELQRFRTVRSWLDRQDAPDGPRKDLC